MKKGVIITLTLGFLALAFISLLSGTAAAQSQTITTSVTQQGQNVIIEVNRGDEPVGGATVTVTSLGNTTELDGEYVTGANGQVVFGETEVKELSGVVHLRIDVQAGNSYRSELVTITRSPNIQEAAPLGQRLSMSLEKGVASTRGTIQGNVLVTRVETIGTDENKIEVLRDHAVEVIRNISQRNVRQETLGRRLATGQISPLQFYVQTVDNLAYIEMLRSDLTITLQRLNKFDARLLHDNGVDPGAAHNMQRSLQEGGEISTDPSTLLVNE